MFYIYFNFWWKITGMLKCRIIFNCAVEILIFLSSIPTIPNPTTSQDSNMENVFSVTHFSE